MFDGASGEHSPFQRAATSELIRLKINYTSGRFCLTEFTFFLQAGEFLPGVFGVFERTAAGAFRFLLG